MPAQLTPGDIYDVLSQIFPKQNDFIQTDYHEALKELLYFGIDSKISFLDLIIKHRDEVLTIDAEELDDFHIKYYQEEYGVAYVMQRIKNKFWFSYLGLLRIALTLEFGAAYEQYANERDGI